VRQQYKWKNVQYPVQLSGIPHCGRISNSQVGTESRKKEVMRRQSTALQNSHPLRAKALHQNSQYSITAGTAITLTEPRRHGVAAELNRCGGFHCLAAISYPAQVAAIFVLEIDNLVAREHIPTRFCLHLLFSSCGIFCGE
jgi:hypothetical protein